MATPAAAPLANYLFERLRSDVTFLHSQSLLDGAEKDTILARIDTAAARAASNLSASPVATGVNALAGQFGNASLGSNTGPPQHVVQALAHQPQQPPQVPARHIYIPPVQQDTRERVRAEWAYGGTQPDDLVFQKNDIIVIVTKENDHWWRGFVEKDPSARMGLFPSNYVKPHVENQVAPYSPPAPSYYAPSDSEKASLNAAMQPYQTHQHNYYGAPPPQPPVQYYQQPPGQMAPPPSDSPGDPAKKNKFKFPGKGSGLGNTLAHSAAGGAGFGAASALTSNLVNAIL